MADLGEDAASRLPTLRVSAYRCFRDEAAVALRPLTLIYGHNQAGKSTLLRLLPLLADSLRAPVPCLDWASAALGGASFKELGWMGPDPVFSPRLGLEAGPEAGWARLSLKFKDDGGPIVNDVIVGVHGDEKRFDVSQIGEVRRTRHEVIARYEGRCRGEEWSGTLSFSGPIPTGLPEPVARDCRRVEAAMAGIERLQWLHANRLEPIQGSPGPSQWCKPDGTDLPDVLVSHGRVVEEASSWMRDREALGERVFVTKDVDGRHRLELAASGRERLPLHLAGEGIRSLLPILLAACAADPTEVGLPSMLAVEEPEAHLHPDLQVALMERLIGAVRSGIPVVLETHSVYLLRRMQLAILKRELEPADVALYWVSRGRHGAASVTSITVQPDAELESWLPGTFEQEQELAREILELRWNNMAGR